MKQKLVLVVLLILSFQGFSQDSKFRLELNYPLTIDDNIIGRNYNGIVDAGLKYRLWDLGLVNLGAGVNAGFYKNTKEDRLPGPDTSTFILSPKIFAEFNIPAIPKLSPYAGVGYSVLFYKVKEYNMDDDIVVDPLDGINLNAGVSFDITKWFFVQVQYDFIRLRLEEGTPDFKYNTNVNILKAGLGVRF